MMRSFADGSVAVVTGSSRGIGFEVARALANAGASVVINGRDQAALDDAVSTLGTSARVAGVAGSAADPDVVGSLLDAALELGTPDILVNCAGTAEPAASSILDIAVEDWRALIDVHLHATFLTCRAFAPLMVEAGRGWIVNTSSHAFTGSFGGTGYPAGKGGVNSLTYALAAELREHGVKVNAVCPGAETRLSSGPDYEAHIERLHRRGILDDLMHAGAQTPPPAEYVAQLYLFLAGTEAPDVTGRVFAGAGGYIGEFPRPVEQYLTWRDHGTSPPWTPDEIATLLAPDP
ncbi:SDR family NAD(P)-dependent oxidoreductase [Actinomadura sp. BRA 177]|uniref:SDR family NAD(P)-dependent oxidoreductase n=1 Tax=Actinomadura sp. BRA 177 TaxID=2745202 RepID=UPI001594EF93|nr:SDR family oxidoreductase [Actinomadura sp. BRA 177]NVI86274.1 SDR family oxidoreductase [Actinomadura sp. BRA 177]